jgi:hypothetical protein
MLKIMFYYVVHADRYDVDCLNYWLAAVRELVDDSGDVIALSHLMAD